MSAAEDLYVARAEAESDGAAGDLYVVRAETESDGFLIGIYGPFEGVAAAVMAAGRNHRDGVKTTVIPLRAPERLDQVAAGDGA